MKTIISTALSCGVAALALAHAGGAAANDVGVSVQISQPGVYGRIDIGRYPQPQVVVAQPILIARPVGVHQAPPPQPVYMWVPPDQRRNWRRHCGQYNACGVPVYFVQDQWYGEHVRGPGKGHDRGRDRSYDRSYDRGYDKGYDKDHGKGKGKGKHDD